MSVVRYLWHISETLKSDGQAVHCVCARIGTRLLVIGNWFLEVLYSCVTSNSDQKKRVTTKQFIQDLLTA